MRFDHHKAKYYELKSTGFKYYYFCIALMGYAVGEYTCTQHDLLLVLSSSICDPKPVC